jgi:hypothetical protein
MDARYERAGTVGFRCAADLHQPPSCTDPLCASFEAPDAFIDVTATGARDWIVPMPLGANGSSTLARKDIETPLISQFGAAGSALTPCTTPPPGVSLSWTDGSGCSLCASARNVSGELLCSVGGSIVFSVAASTDTRTLTVIGGAFAASPIFNATLSDGSVTHVSIIELNATASDVSGTVYHTVAWAVKFKSSVSNARLFVKLSSSGPLVPPPPPPPGPLPLCKHALCGSVLTTQGDVSLTAAGATDWVHFGMATTNRKVGVPTLISNVDSNNSTPLKTYSYVRCLFLKLSPSLLSSLLYRRKEALQPAPQMLHPALQNTTLQY